MGKLAWEIDWTQEHFTPDHAGVNPYEVALSPNNVSTLVTRWAVRKPMYVQDLVAVDGVVYVGGADESGLDKTHVFALDARNRHRLWHAVQLHGSAISGISVLGHTIFASTVFDHSLRAYDTTSGKLLWKVQSTGAFSQATVYNGRLLVQTNSGILEALDPATGAVLWQRSGVGPGSELGPAVVDNAVYVTGYPRNMIRVFRANDGHFLWSVDLPDHPISAPTVVDGILYEGTLFAGLCAVSVSAHHLSWCQPMEQATENTRHGDDSVAYIGDGHGAVYAFDRTTGEPLWDTPLGWRFVLGTPVEANGVVYAATQGIYAMDATTGQILWSHPSGIVNTDPIVVNGVVYVGDFDGNVYAFGLPSSS